MYYVFQFGFEGSYQNTVMDCVVYIAELFGKSIPNMLQSNLYNQINDMSPHTQLTHPDTQLCVMRL